MYLKCSIWDIYYTVLCIKTEIVPHAEDENVSDAHGPRLAISFGNIHRTSSIAYAIIITYRPTPLRGLSDLDDFAYTEAYDEGEATTI